MLIWIDLCVIVSFFFPLSLFSVVVTCFVCLFFFFSSTQSFDCFTYLLHDSVLSSNKYYYYYYFESGVTMFYALFDEIFSPAPLFLLLLWCLCVIMLNFLNISESLSRWPLNRNRKNEIYVKIFSIFFLLFLSPVDYLVECFQSTQQISNKLYTHTNTSTSFTDWRHTIDSP